MKSLYSLVTIVMVWMSVFCTISCMSEKEIETTPECAIATFSVADIQSTLHTTSYNGGDSTYTKTIAGTTIYFNIDQVSRTISNVEPLPSWADITRLVPSIGCNGYPFVKYEGDSVYYAFQSGKDSIDFTHPVEMTVLATDGISKRSYTVTIRKSTATKDSIFWNEVAAAPSCVGSHRLISHNGLLRLFSENGNVSTSADGSVWTTASFSTEIDLSSIVAFGSSLYALNNEGKLFTSADATTWTPAPTDLKFSQLLAADHFYLYAFDGEHIMATSNLTDWTINGRADFDYLPSSAITYVAYTTKTNSNLQNVILAGYHPDMTSTPVWFKIASGLALSNQEWNYIQITSDNSYALPPLKGVSITSFGSMLYAIGGSHDTFYYSEDNGITWRKFTDRVGVPEGMAGTADRQVSICVHGNSIVMVQSGNASQPSRVWIGKK